MQKEKLARIRKAKGYTQKEIAEILATDVSNYSRKENGTVKIYKEEWNKIAQFLEVPLEQIYEDEDNSVIVQNPVFNDSPGSTAGINVNNFNNDLSIEVIKNLQDYIKLLNEEIQRLKKNV